MLILVHVHSTPSQQWMLVNWSSTQTTPQSAFYSRNAFIINSLHYKYIKHYSRPEIIYNSVGPRYTELVKLLLESGAAVDYRPDTGEEFPRTTLCDEPLRLAIRNKHYVSIPDDVQNTSPTNGGGCYCRRLSSNHKTSNIQRFHWQ